jgi:hydrogenase maturation protein HypF
VGFRPFVYRLALAHGLVGWVLNASDGVHAHVEGETRHIDAFTFAVRAEAPEAARIDRVSSADSAVEGYETFSIRLSDPATDTTTLVSPDIATCPACLAELFDPADRRYGYPFINCTNCGPRFTIIDALPYDRANTSMAAFALCATCDTEYHDPVDRRFHAQPDACFDCGPHLSLWERGGDTHTALNRAESQQLICAVADRIRAGGIVAIKGLGGYHLACDATDEDAVARLRKRKRRTDKPFACMVRSLEQARELCHVSEQEAALLSGSIRPIVLLRRRDTARPARSVARGLPELGLMLPCTPVQHLLMAELDRPLVMTSGNISEEPILASEDEAHRMLGAVADAFLDNDRAILSRYDDSVVRVVEGQTHMVRRARGYAPRPLPFCRSASQSASLPPSLPVPQASLPSLPQLPGIIAAGSEQKNTFCFTRGGDAFVSQHLGDLENASSFAAWLNTLELYQRLFDLNPQVIACDMHPEYLSTKWAHSADLPRIEVQHHHAHIASVLAEHGALAGADARVSSGDEQGEAGEGRETDTRRSAAPQEHPVLTERVIGVALDGTGYGADGVIWGGEFLIASLVDYERFATLEPVPLPGGRAAIEHPDRMAWSYLHSLGLSGHPGALPLAAHLDKEQTTLLGQIVSKRLLSPLTSSMGRLFDAASALIGTCMTSTYEGQAAVELEAALWEYLDGNDTPTACLHDGSSAVVFREQSSEEQDGAQRSSSADTKHPRFSLGVEGILSSLLDDIAEGQAPGLISLRFHEAIIRLIVTTCKAAREATGLRTIALSGGVFMNRYLLVHLVPRLESEGFTVLQNRELPANDGCIAYGQAAVAAARLTPQAKLEIVSEEPQNRKRV